MAASPATPKIPYHARSVSLPSKSHPLTLSVEEQLHSLRVSESAPSSSSSICRNLGALENLYDSVEDLLQLQLAWRALAHKQGEKCVEDVLDGSLRLLDVCGATSDALTQVKEQVQDLQSAFRRKRGGEFDLGSEISAYMLSKKKVNKKICKSLGGLKKMEKNGAFSPLVDEDYDSVSMGSMLREVETITLSVFRSLLSFLSRPKAQSKSSGWSVVSKLIHTKRVACEEVYADISDMMKVDAALKALIGHKSCKIVLMKNAQKQLEDLEASIQDLEDGLECIFRRLIRNRVSLLSIFNH